MPAQRKAGFRLRDYEGHLKGYPAAWHVAAKCNLGVMINLADHALHKGKRSHRDTQDEGKEKTRKLECAISGFRAAEEIFRNTEQTEDADRCASYAFHFGEILELVKSDYRPKALGFLGAKHPPGALRYWYCLNEYIAVKNARRPHLSVIAHIISALLTGFGRDSEINPEVLAKRFKTFREGNPFEIEDIRRKTECDSSGANFLDRKYGNLLQRNAESNHPPKPQLDSGAGE